MKFDILYSELIQSTEMIRSLLAGVTPQEARVKPDPKSWSFLEVVCHLYDEEREDFREHLDFILNRQTEQWHRIDPGGWVTQRKYNEQDFSASCERFFLERRKSLEWLKSLAKADWNIRCTTPYRSMTAGDMFASWIAHDNLHIRQLVELRRTRIEAIAEPYIIEYAGDW